MNQSNKEESIKLLVTKELLIFKTFSSLNTSYAFASRIKFSSAFVFKRKRERKRDKKK